MGNEIEARMSRGHLCFAGDYEYFQDNYQNVYRAELNGEIELVGDNMGYRIGARFYCTMERWTAKHVPGTPVGMRLNKLDGVPAKEKATAEAVNIVRCDNCRANLTERDIIPLVDVVDLGDRLDPGSIVPVGECLICGALVYQA